MNRGGSRNNKASNCQWANRDGPPNSHNNNGFRVALISSGKRKTENAKRYIPILQVAAILIGRYDESSLNSRLLFSRQYALALSDIHCGLFRPTSASETHKETHKGTFYFFMSR